MTDLHLNHISARVPGNEEHFLINPFGMMYEEITASSLIKVDLAGKIIANANPEYGINLPGYVIHSAIHGARHDVACVLHTHTNAGMAVSVLKCGLLPLTQTAMRWARVAYHDFEGVVVDLDEQKRLVANLGDSEVMILRNHGLLAVGKTIGQAFNNIYRLERACQTQLLALACNSEIAMPPQDVIARSNAQLTVHAVAGRQGHSAGRTARWSGRRSSACSTGAIRRTGPDGGAWRWQFRSTPPRS